MTPAARIVASDSLEGFTPGILLAGRDRVIGLLGRGGMGEVYRADDLKLPRLRVLSRTAEVI